MSQKIAAIDAPALPLNRRLVIIFAIFVAVVLADQITKAVIMASIPSQGNYYSTSETPKFFEFTHCRNEGIVNGIFQNNRLMARLAPLGALLVLIYLFGYLDPHSKVQTIAFGMVAGGAIGNLIDRFRLGSVTDFLHFHFYFIPFDFPWKDFPPFNVADSCICTGVFFLALSWLIMGQRDLPRSASE